MRQAQYEQSSDSAASSSIVFCSKIKRILCSKCIATVGQLLNSGHANDSPTYSVVTRPSPASEIQLVPPL